MNVAVIALGKIGLPLAVQVASKGWRVRGVDISQEVVDLVNRGTAPFPGEAHLDERLSEVVKAGLLTATVDTAAAVAESDHVLVVVPLMTDPEGNPDFSAMDSATSLIAGALRPGTLVSYETTLPVGTTRSRFLPALVTGSGLSAGEGFFLVHSPERVFSGRVFADLRRYPKLVGGVDEASTERGVEFYSKVLDFDDRQDLERGNGVWAMSSVEAAEMAKLVETTYRDVNIALANEFARFSESAGIDVGEVIEAANSQPFSHVHRPGVAVGGHCIPVYPRFYLAGHRDAALVELARRVNARGPERAVDTVEAALGGLGGERLLILGAAYRGGVKETAYSGVFDLARLIEDRGGDAVVADPLYSADELVTLGLHPWDGGPVSAAVIQTDHAEYRRLGPDDVPGARFVYDGRRVVDPGLWAGSGVTLFVIGHGITAS